MTTRADVDRLTTAQRRLVEMALDDLKSFFGGLDVSNAAATRDALLDVVPMLVREYGDLAASVAAEWYESVRPGEFLTQLAEGVPTSQVESSIRYAAGHLWDEDVPAALADDGSDVPAHVMPAEPDKTLAVLSGAVQRFIQYSGRATVARNVERDPMKPRFARVPQGAKTCAWCSMLASRGFVYVTKQTAGATDEFHDECDCQIVAEFDKDAHHIDGYDPDRLYEMYSAARQQVGDVSDQKLIAAKMRQLFPGEFTDSHVH